MSRPGRYNPRIHDSPFGCDTDCLREIVMGKGWSSWDVMDMDRSDLIAHALSSGFFDKEPPSDSEKRVARALRAITDKIKASTVVLADLERLEEEEGSYAWKVVTERDEVVASAALHTLWDLADKNGYKPLPAAEHYQLTTYLVARMEEPNPPYERCGKKSDGVTPLHKAAELSATGIVDALLRAGADPNIRDKTYGATPLHHALEFERKGQAATVELLIARGADVTLQDKCWRETPLEMAKRQRRPEAVIQLLKDRVALVERRDRLCPGYQWDS